MRMSSSQQRLEEDYCKSLRQEDTTCVQNRWTTAVQANSGKMNGNMVSVFDQITASIPADISAGFGSMKPPIGPMATQGHTGRLGG